MNDEIDMERRFIREKGVAGVIAGLAGPVIESLGFRLVRVVASGRDGGTVQIMAERPGGQIDVNELARISRQLSPLLDAEDPLEGRYYLEVSSPGIDRPLVRLSDFERWAGHQAKIKLHEAVDGVKRFRGVIVGVENGEVLLEVPPMGQKGRRKAEGSGKEKGPGKNKKSGKASEQEQGQEDEKIVLGFAPSMIAEAKLVMTDELIREALAGKAAQSATAGVEEN